MPAEQERLPVVGGSVPAEVVAAARAAFGERRPDTGTALLVRDSYDDAGPLGVERTITYSGGGIDVEVSISSASGATKGAVVEVRPSGVEGLEVRLAGAATGTEVLAEPVRDGVWSITPAPSGPVSLSTRVAGSVVCTAWVRW